MKPAVVYLLFAVAIGALFAILYGVNKLTDEHARYGHAELDASVAVDEWETATGLKAGTDLVVVRCYGGADNMWFEFRLPPSRLPEMVAGMKKVAEDHPPTEFVKAAGGVKPGNSSVGIPNPRWFQPLSLAPPTQVYFVRFGRRHYSMAYSEVDGRILMRTP